MTNCNGLTILMKTDINDTSVFMYLTNSATIDYVSYIKNLTTMSIFNLYLYYDKNYSKLELVIQTANSLGCNVNLIENTPGSDITSLLLNVSKVKSKKTIILY